MRPRQPAATRAALRRVERRPAGHTGGGQGRHWLCTRLHPTALAFHAAGRASAGGSARARGAGASVCGRGHARRAPRHRAGRAAAGRQRGGRLARRAAVVYPAATYAGRAGSTLLGGARRGEARRAGSAWPCRGASKARRRPRVGDAAPHSPPRRRSDRGRGAACEAAGTPARVRQRQGALPAEGRRSRAARSRAAHRRPAARGRDGRCDGCRADAARATGRHLRGARPTAAQSAG
eukprot:660609-Prymnesium_polylepis.1